MMTAETAIAKCKELAKQARYQGPIDSADKLWELEKLKHKRDRLSRECDLKSAQYAQLSLQGNNQPAGMRMKEYQKANKERVKVNTQISKLLEDE